MQDVRRVAPKVDARHTHMFEGWAGPDAASARLMGDSVAVLTELIAIHGGAMADASRHHNSVRIRAAVNRFSHPALTMLLVLYPALYGGVASRTWAGFSDDVYTTFAQAIAAFFIAVTIDLLRALVLASCGATSSSLLISWRAVGLDFSHAFVP